MTADLDALIAKLEAATGPSKELDRAIADAVMERDDRPCGEEEQEDGTWRTVYVPWYVLNGYATTFPPEFTRSLDAALMLVPADAFWRVGHDGEGPNPGDFRADVLLPMPAERRSFASNGVAPTPALALCIAALEARASTKEQAHAP